MEVPYQNLFSYLSQEHDLRLTITQLHEVVAAVEKDKAEATEALHTAYYLPCALCGDFGRIDNQEGTTSVCPCHY